VLLEIFSNPRKSLFYFCFFVFLQALAVYWGDMKLHKSRFSNIFRSFLISYIIILLIPSVAGYTSYKAAIDVAETGSIDTSLMVLKQSKDILERRMDEVEAFTTKIAMNQDLARLLSETVSAGNYPIYDLRKIWQDVYAYGLTNDFLQDFYIYLKNYNVIISPKSVYLRTDHYYEQYHYNDLSFEQWKETILEKGYQHWIMPLRPYSSNGKETMRISYVQSIPLNNINHPLGAVVIPIDEKKIGSLLDSIPNQYGGWAYISDNQGNTLAAVGIDESKVKGLQTESRTIGDVSKRYRDDTLLISIRSKSNGWLYTAGIPRQAIMKKANEIKKNTWIVTAAALLLGLIISLLLAYRNSAPIHKLIGILMEQFGQDSAKKINGFHFLHGNISSLITNNKKLEAELNQQAPLLRDAFLKRLVKGEFESLNEIRAMASQTGIELHGEFGYVGLIQVNGYGGMDSKDVLNELHAARLLIKQKLQEIAGNLHLTDTDSDKIVVIVMLRDEPDSEAEKDIEAMINSLRAAALSEYRISLTVSMGAVFHGFPDISRSFYEARRAMELAAFTKVSGVLWHDNMPKESETFYFPIDLELRLLNALKAGEQSEVKRIVSLIFEQNFVERDLSPEMALQLVGQMKGTIIKLLDQKGLIESDVMEKLRDQTVRIQLSDGLDKVRHDMENLMEALCHMIVNYRKERENETVRTLISRLEELYGDPDLSVYNFAETVGRPERYISQLFKEHTGQTLSEYLEQVRINKAIELLVHTGMTIDEIARQTGYNSAHSFRRAFKRVSGALPGKFRYTAGE
jgi:two-component system, response regulator YesN